jgi:acetyltransferase-like isoleucine patch superfamily enzyme
MGHAFIHHLPVPGCRDPRDVPGPQARWELVIAGEPTELGDKVSWFVKRNTYRGFMAVTALPGLKGIRKPSIAEAGGSRMDEVLAGLEHEVDLHTFRPKDVEQMATLAGFGEVRVVTEELTSNWFGWAVRTIEGSVREGVLGVRWAHDGLQRLPGPAPDRRRRAQPVRPARAVLQPDPARPEAHPVVSERGPPGRRPADRDAIGTRRAPVEAEVVVDEAVAAEVDDVGTDGAEVDEARGPDALVDEPGLVDELAHAAVAEHTEALTRAETAREGQRRLEHSSPTCWADAAVPDVVRRPPLRLRYPRFGWRRAIRHAVERRMVTRQYLELYRRHLVHRARAAATGPPVVFQGVVFTGKRVEFHARPAHGRLVLGPWCWIGNDNKLRAHEGQLTLGPKVVMGRDNVINTYLDIEVGGASILADWIYVCDFDHRYDRLDVPIKDQGIVKSPVRIGGDVWIGEKATVLRGVDIGHGSVVASHCLVNADIPPFSIAVGVPVRVVKSRCRPGWTPRRPRTSSAGAPDPDGPARLRRGPLSLAVAASSSR